MGRDAAADALRKAGGEHGCRGAFASDHGARELPGRSALPLAANDLPGAGRESYPAGLERIDSLDVVQMRERTRIGEKGRLREFDVVLDLAVQFVADVFDGIAIGVGNGSRAIERAPDVFEELTIGAEWRAIRAHHREQRRSGRDARICGFRQVGPVGGSDREFVTSDELSAVDDPGPSPLGRGRVPVGNPADKAKKVPDLKDRRPGIAGRVELDELDRVHDVRTVAEGPGCHEPCPSERLSGSSAVGRGGTGAGLLWARLASCMSGYFSSCSSRTCSSTDPGQTSSSRTM